MFEYIWNNLIYLMESALELFHMQIRNLIFLCVLVNLLKQMTQSFKFLLIICDANIICNSTFILLIVTFL